VNKKFENENCLLTQECLGNMKCENGACHCKIGQHFDQTELICLDNTLINTSCTSNRTCNRLLGLSCQDYKCQCDSLKKYWSYEEQKCVNLLSYGEIGCKTKHECFGNLNCDYGMCNCGRTTLNEMYWNGSLCVNAGGNWDKCEKDYQCKKPYVCLDKISRCSTQNFLTSLFKSNSACLKINNFLISIFLIYSML